MKITKHFEHNDQLQYNIFMLLEEVRKEVKEESLLDVTVETHRKTRSNMQNRYYWGFLVQPVADELGYDREVMHDHFKKLFLGYEEYDMPDGTTTHKLKSTTDETTITFEDYTAKIRQWASEFLNMYLPLPNETPYNYLEVK